MILRVLAAMGFGAAKVISGKYNLGPVLGRGATAKVYRATNINSGQSVAIKCISKRDNADPALIKREIAVMRRLRHPHITRLIEVLASRSKVYFILELAEGGNLLSHISTNKIVSPLSEDEARRYFHQLISAVQYCHSRGVFHRDLKPENLLLDANGILKVSDFGLSALLPETSSNNILLRTQCGTPAFVAPEILRKKEYSGAAVDVWSCGIILFVLTTGRLPFDGSNKDSMFRRICRGTYQCPKKTSPELRLLISRLLDTNPETRIKVGDILLDPWYQKGLDGEDGEEEVVGREAVCGGLPAAVELNAFDLISFAAGLNLSGLFEPGSNRERFVSTGEMEDIVLRLEEMGREEEVVIKRVGKEGGEFVLEERRTGNPVASVEVGRLTEGLLVVEVETCGGRSSEHFRGKVLAALNGPNAAFTTLVRCEA